VDTHAIAEEIVDIRNRLAEIEFEKSQPMEDGPDYVAGLTEEASSLETRMAVLQGILAEGGVRTSDLDAKLQEKVSKARIIPPM
jgi:hypothetical protein